jgi:hypothetical protein
VRHAQLELAVLDPYRDRAQPPALEKFLITCPTTSATCGTTELPRALRRYIRAGIP